MQYYIQTFFFNITFITWCHFIDTKIAGIDAASSLQTLLSVKHIAFLMKSWTNWMENEFPCDGFFTLDCHVIWSLCPLHLFVLLHCVLRTMKCKIKFKSFCCYLSFGALMYWDNIHTHVQTDPFIECYSLQK